VNELEQLVAEQARDMKRRHFVQTDSGTIHYDAFPSGADLFHLRSKKLVNDPRHGTLNCYTHLKCRCSKCRAAMAQAKREQRRKKPRFVSRPFVYQMCCQSCGGTDVKRTRVYV
jgi:hypothetical protein